MQLTLLQWNIHGLVSKASSLLHYIHTHNTAVIVLQETLVTDASVMRLGRQYQVFHQPYEQGGSRGLITLVRKDIPATLTRDPPGLGDQVDSLCVTLHLDIAHGIDVYNVYCRQRSHLNLLPLLENNDGRPVLLSGDQRPPPVPRALGRRRRKSARETHHTGAGGLPVGGATW